MKTCVCGGGDGSTRPVPSPTAATAGSPSAHLTPALLRGGFRVSPRPLAQLGFRHFPPKGSLLFMFLCVAALRMLLIEARLAFLSLIAIPCVYFYCVQLHLRRYFCVSFSSEFMCV